MKHDKSGKPENLDGDWQAQPDMDGYTIFRAGPSTVRYHPGYEPDGELVTANRRVSVHAERMDSGSWSIILTDENGHDTHIDLWSKKPIHVMWRDEPPLPKDKTLSVGVTIGDTVTLSTRDFDAMSHGPEPVQ